MSGRDPWDEVGNYEERLKHGEKPRISDELKKSIPLAYGDIIKVAEGVIRMKASKRLTAQKAADRIGKMVW